MEGNRLNNFSELSIGSIVRKETEKDSLFITEYDQLGAIGVSHIHITNPNEWFFEGF